MKTLYSAVAMTTGKRLLRNTVGIAAALCAAAVPGYCGTSYAYLTYTGGAGVTGAAGATITVTGDSNTESLSSFTAPITVLEISGSSDTADDAYWNVTGGTETITKSGSTEVVTVTGTLGTCNSFCTGTSGNNLGNITGSQTLEQIVYNLTSIPFSSPLSGTSFNTNTPSQSTFALNLGAAASVTDLPLLLTDLSLSSSTSQVNSGGTNGNYYGGTSPYAFTPSSSTLGLTLTTTTVSPTPEPVSFLLLGTGLMGVALVARRRRSSQN